MFSASVGPESENCGPSGAQSVTARGERQAFFYETGKSRRYCSASTAFAPLFGCVSALYRSYHAYPSSIPGMRKQKKDGKKEACIREEESKEKIRNVSEKNEISACITILSPNSFIKVVSSVCWTSRGSFSKSREM